MNSAVESILRRGENMRRESFWKKKTPKDRRDEDLTSIFESLTNETRQSFPNNPEMDFFWQLKKQEGD